MKTQRIQNDRLRELKQEIRAYRKAARTRLSAAEILNGIRMESWLEGWLTAVEMVLEHATMTAVDEAELRRAAQAVRAGLGSPRATQEE